jgi:TonB family protein
MTNNCMNCGAVLLSGTAICPVCQQPTGLSQPIAGGPRTPAAPPPAYGQRPPGQLPYGPPPAGSSNTGMTGVWLAGIGVVLLLILGGIAGLIFYASSRKASLRNDNYNYNRQARAYPSPTEVEPPPPPINRGANGSRAPISGGVLNAKATSLPKPAYPAIARATHASGTVVVQVTVDETGKVTSARAVSGHPLLQAAAVQAAYQARFTPTKLSGQPVKVTGMLTYNFAAE